MIQTYQHWKVRPHGKFSKIDESILTVTGPIRMQLGSFPRRMTVICLSDSRLVVWVVKLNLVKDANALRARLLQWAEMDSLKRILVSHGEPIEANPRQALRDLAESLA